MIFGNHIVSIEFFLSFSNCVAFHVQVLTHFESSITLFIIIIFLCLSGLFPFPKYQQYFFSIFLCLPSISMSSFFAPQNYGYYTLLIISYYLIIYNIPTILIFSNQFVPFKLFLYHRSFLNY